MARGALPKQVKQIELVEGRAGADTIRLWEHFRDHAYMWRAIALWQLPTTLVALCAAVLMYYTADTIVEVPEKPQPGHYSIKQLPDAEFIEVATRLVNLITTYQPHNAREQFSSARKYLWEPALTQFENDVMLGDLKIIEQTARSQIFFVAPKLVSITRYPDLDKVMVRVPGIRQKLIGQKPLPPEGLTYYIKMTTIPRNIHNEYGIVIVDVRILTGSLDQIEAQDKRDELEKEREEVQHRRLQRKGMAPPAIATEAPPPDRAPLAP